MDHIPVSPKHRLSSVTDHGSRSRPTADRLHVLGSLKSPTKLRIYRKISERCPTELPPQMDESQLEFLDSIGKGAFGRAIKVRHRELGCLLVLKEVLTECKEDETALVREISLICSLNHPNILGCMGVVTRNRKICLLTEYIPRGCLHNLIVEPIRYPLSWSTLVSFAKDIANGMDFLHQHDLLHRDLTTWNCLVRQDNSVVVSDFGLSKFVHQPRDLFFQAKDPVQPASESGNIEEDINQNKFRKRGVRPKRHTVVGSPFWMAPEMLAGKPYNNAVDVYSFGIILCQLLARCDADPDHIPREPNRMSVDVERFLAGERVSEDRPDMLVAMAVRCVDFDPDSRPTFLDCLEWLEDCLLYLTTGHMVSNELTIPKNSNVEPKENGVNHKQEVERK